MDEESKANEFALLHEELSFAPNWKLSPRVKFVCVDHAMIDDRFFVALGTHTGSIYIFERITTVLHHLTTLIKEEGVVNIVKFSQNGRRLACALNNGHLLIFSINLLNHQFECIRVSVQHKGRTVQAMTWGGDDVIYSGDGTGFVSVTFVPASKSQDFISLPSAPIQNLGSPVVQMDFNAGQICVSTEKSVSLFDTETRTFCTVGSKPRQGKFGACFAAEKDGAMKLLCARPGYRIWQTNGDNVVSLTQLYKSFTAKKPSRVWGMPLKPKNSVGRSGVLKFLRSLGNGVLAFVDVLGNFYFVDFVAQIALDFLPCPSDLAAFSMTGDGRIVLLLESNRIALLHFAATAVALNLLARSPWTSDAVEFIVKACAVDRSDVMKHLESKALSQLLECAGESDPSYAELLALLKELKAQRQQTLADLESRVKILGSEGNQSPRPEVESRDETRSDASETSFNSADVLDAEKMLATSQKNRGSDLLFKVRTKLKETSSRVKAEMSSDLAQHLMKKVKDTTSKMKTDAGQLIKSNIASPIVSPDLDSSPGLRAEEDPEEERRVAKVQRRLVARPALNFVELEAAVFICWESANVRFANDQFQANLASLSEASFCKFKAALKDFQEVLLKQLNVYHFHLNQASTLRAKSSEPEEEGEEQDRELAQEKESQTVPSDFWRAFPTPVKVQELCSRIAVLSFFVKLQDEKELMEEPAEDSAAMPDASGDTGSQEEPTEDSAAMPDASGGTGPRKEPTEDSAAMPDASGDIGSQEETTEDSAAMPDASGDTGSQEETTEDSAAMPDTSGGTGPRKEPTEDSGAIQEAVDLKEESSEDEGVEHKRLDFTESKQEVSGDQERNGKAEMELSEPQKLEQELSEELGSQKSLENLQAEEQTSGNVESKQESSFGLASDLNGPQTAGTHRKPQKPSTVPLMLDKSIQASSLVQMALPATAAPNSAEYALLQAVEAEFDLRKMHTEFGFVEAAFTDLLQTLHADLAFWRSCLQSIPISRKAFASHFHAVRGLMDESVSLYRNLDCSSMEFIGLLEKAIVSEKLLGLFLLEIFFSKQPRQALRFCVQNSVFINFRDVFNLLSYHEHLSLWSDYVRQMLEKDYHAFIGTLRSNDDLLLATVMISAMQDSHSSTPRSVCEACGFKIFLSPAGLQATDSPLRSIFDVTDDSWALSVAERWLLRNGHWTAYCHALVARRRIHVLILTAFNTDQRDMLLALPRLRREDLLTMVSLMLRNQAPSCPLCGHASALSLSSFSWAFIGDQITANLPASKALQLLSAVEIPDTADCAGLFRRLRSTMASAAGAQQSFLSLTPSATETIGAECSQHWGKEVSDISECCLCGGTLTTPAGGEVVIAPCCQNHFHADCMPARDFCAICLK